MIFIVVYDSGFPFVDQALIIEIFKFKNYTMYCLNISQISERKKKLYNAA